MKPPPHEVRSGGFMPCPRTFSELYPVGPEGISPLLSHLSLDGGDGHDTHDVVGRAAARKVVNRLGDALQDGAVGVGAGEALDQLVADVAGLEVREHEHVGLTGDGGAGSLELGDGGDDGGVELQVAIDGELGSLLLAELYGLLDLLGDLAAGGAMVE